MKGKLYMSAPLPFVGQKRMFAREYILNSNRQCNSVEFIVS